MLEHADDILDNSVITTLCGPFLFQHDNAPMDKARSIKIWSGFHKVLTSMSSNTKSLNISINISS